MMNFGVPIFEPAEGNPSNTEKLTEISVYQNGVRIEHHMGIFDVRSIEKDRIIFLTEEGNRIIICCASGVAVIKEFFKNTDK